MVAHVSRTAFRTVRTALLCCFCLVSSAFAASVTTDTTDYPPGSTVTITGSGYWTNEMVTVQVTHADGTPTGGVGHDPWTVQAGSSGGFVTSWTVPYDDNLNEYLLVTATGQSSGQVATAMFLDAIGTDLDQLQNGTQTSSPEWANGNINGNNSCYSEADEVPYRYFVTGTTGGTKHFFTINFQWTKGGRHAFDYITSYDQSEAGPIATAGGPCGSPNTPPGDCATPTGTYPIPHPLVLANYTGSIPSNFFTTVNPLFAVEGPGVLSFYNASIDSIGKYTITGPVGDQDMTFKVYFTTTATGSVGFFWGGHLASADNATGWGTGNGSASVSGAPFHMRAKDFDGGGGANQDRSIQNGELCLPPIADITCLPTDSVCFGSTYSCSIATGAGSYDWTVTGGTILSGDGTNSITYSVTGSIGGTVTVAVEACNLSTSCAGDFCCATDQVVIPIKDCNTCPTATCAADTSVFLCGPQQVCISGFSCFDIDGNLVSCNVTGGTLSGNTVCFTPSSPGVYPLTLIATDASGCADTCTTTVTVSFNAPPVATNPPASVDTFMCAAAQICRQFSATDVNGGPLTWAILSGTGTVSPTGLWCFTPSGTGSFCVSATVADTCGAKDTLNLCYNVTINTPPVATNPPASVDTFMCAPAQICRQFAATDVNGGTLTWAQLSGVGTVSTGGLWCFTPAGPGSYCVQATVADPCGAKDTVSMCYNITQNQFPVATCPGSYSLTVCDLSQICISGFSCSDPDNNLTSCNAVGGTLSGNQICFTPIAGANVIKLIATDACGLADTCETVVTVTLNQPPVAINPPPSIDTFMCLPAQVCRQFSATDPNGNGLTWALLSGSGTVSSAGVWCFTPSAAGTYCVYATVADPCGAKDTVYACYNVTLNRPPIISLGVDKDTAMCAPAQICVPYTVSDPDGLTGFVESLVSGPPGATIDVVNNLVCFTPSVSTTYTVRVRVTDPCGAENEDEQLVTIRLNRPPDVAFGIDKTFKLCAPEQRCETYGVADPDGLTGIVETVVAAPGGTIFDPAQNTVCYTPNVSGTYTFVVRATDPCGAFDQDTIVWNVVVNQPPTIALASSAISLEYCIGRDTTICVDYIVSDPNVGEKLTEIVSSGPASIDTALNRICFPVGTSGTYPIVVQVTDSCGALAKDTVTFTINRILCCPSITIEKRHNVIQGTISCLSIVMDGEIFRMGGFNLLIAYDQSALSPYGVTPGIDLTDCLWEYFTYRFGANGNCGTGCPSGLISITALAETNNGAWHPDCFGPATETDQFDLAELCFLVSNDRTLECQFSHVSFFWTICGDNTVSSIRGDTLFMSDEVFDYDNPMGIQNPTAGFPGPYGAQDFCFIGGGPNKPAPLSCIDFYNGGIDIVCADSIDARGDVNLNNVAYEIADAVMFTRYFLIGLPAFAPVPNSDGAIAATDVNADGAVLTVADLVYLIRVIVGDALAIPKLQPVPVALTRDGDVLSVDAEIGAASLVIRGEAIPRNLTDNMTMESRFDGENTRILIYPPFGEGQTVLQSFRGAFLEVPGEIVSIDMATPEGIPVAKGNLTPSDYMLEQNYPNPFNPSTTIDFSIPLGSEVRIEIFNVLGQSVRVLTDGYRAAGYHSLEWDGLDADGAAATSGLYFYRITARGFAETRKMLLLK